MRAAYQLKFNMHSLRITLAEK